MKKTIIAIAVITTLISCNKKKCYQCTVYVSGQSTGTGQSRQTICDMTEDDAKKLEKQGTYQTTTYYMGHTITTSTLTECH